MLNILGGLDRPTAGHVFFRRDDLCARDDQTLTLYRREFVGFVFQFYNLNPSLSARENIQWHFVNRGFLPQVLSCLPTR